MTLNVSFFNATHSIERFEFCDFVTVGLVRLLKQVPILIPLKLRVTKVSKTIGAVVVAQLAERLIPPPVIHGSNPTSSNFDIKMFLCR